MNNVRLDRPVPHPTPLSAPFWEACKRRRLMVQRCDNCATHVFIPRSFCPSCLSEALTWVDGSGRGTVVTYTVVWRPQTPAFEPPYVIAVVRLDEGCEMVTNIVNVTPEKVEIGAPVHVLFVDVSSTITLPCFELDGDPEPAS